MSILNAFKEIKRDNNNLQDMALLPQYLIMQMAQRGEIQKELVPLIISKKAEIIENNARNQALVNSGQTPPTIMEQDMMQIAQAENPAPEPQMQPQIMPQEMAMPQPMPQGMPQLPEEVGIAQNPVPPMQMAGGGIIAFAPGGDIDDDLDEDDEYEELLAQAEEAEAIRNLYDMDDQAYEVDNTDAGVAYAASSMPQSSAVGIKTPSMPQSSTVGLRAVSRDKEEKGPDDLVKRLQAQIMAKESGGRRYDKEGNLLTSSKGAEGEMQVMPYTARDPGFGIRPAKSNNPDELRRVGDEYAAAMYNRYGDPKLAMIAYNMGPGATDKWLASGADPRRLPKETQGYIRGVSLAGGGEVERYQTGGYRPLSAEAANFLQQQKDRTTPAKSTQSGIANKLLRPSMIGSDANVYPGTSDLNYYNELAAELEKDPTYEPYKQEMEKLLKRNPTLLTARQPATNIIGPLANVQRKGEETTKKATPNYMPPVMLEGADNDDASRVMAMPNAAPAPAPAASPAQQKAEDETFNFMQYVRDRQAKIDKTALQDQNLALLAAGLGIMGGTSPYAFANIGQGGAQGVAQLGQLQRLRAQQGVASDKLLGTASNYAAADRFRRDQLAQQKEIKESALAKDLLVAKNTEIGKRLDKAGITSQMIGMLNTKKLMGTASADDLKKLKIYEDQYRNIENEVEKRYASPGAGLRVVGVRPAG